MNLKFQIAAIMFFSLALGTVLTAFGQGARERGCVVKPFGTTLDGKEVLSFTLTNSHGVRAVILNFGGIIYSMEVPDKKGKFENVSLNFEKVSDYQQNRTLFGSLVGRFANRIARGQFTMDGKEYKVYPYNGKTSIHGGKIGFDQVLWQAKSLTEPDRQSVILEYTAKDGEEGFPGNLKTTVKYSLTDQNELILDYTAVTDQMTPINLTNHCYWNLSGALSGSALNHVMRSPATHYLLSDSGLIPTGEIRSVKGTPLDFRSPKSFAQDKAKITDAQFRSGYDHSLILSASLVEGKPQFGAEVTDPISGRGMKVFTTEPVVHLYTANGLNTKRGEHQYKPFDAFCLECQHYPDSPNHADFPDTILRPGQRYRQTTIFQFFTLK